jgi:hypothetical protein
LFCLYLVIDNFEDDLTHRSKNLKKTEIDSKLKNKTDCIRDELIEINEICDEEAKEYSPVKAYLNKSNEQSLLKAQIHKSDISAISAAPKQRSKTDRSYNLINDVIDDFDSNEYDSNRNVFSRSDKFIDSSLLTKTYDIFETEVKISSANLTQSQHHSNTKNPSTAKYDLDELLDETDCNLKENMQFRSSSALNSKLIKQLIPTNNNFAFKKVEKANKYNLNKINEDNRTIIDYEEIRNELENGNNVNNNNNDYVVEQLSLSTSSINLEEVDTLDSNRHSANLNIIDQIDTNTIENNIQTNPIMDKNHESHVTSNNKKGSEWLKEMLLNNDSNDQQSTKISASSINKTKTKFVK